MIIIQESVGTTAGVNTSQIGIKLLYILVHIYISLKQHSVYF